MISMEEVDNLANQPDSVVLSANKGFGNEFFLEKLWEYLSKSIHKEKRRTT